MAAINTEVCDILYLQVSLVSTDSFDNVNQRQLFTMVGMYKVSYRWLVMIFCWLIHIYLYSFIVDWKAHTVAIKRINKGSIDLTREVRMELNLVRI